MGGGEIFLECFVGEGVLTAGGVRLARIADAVGTPVYVYSAEVIRAQYAALAGGPSCVSGSLTCGGR